jgi:hypothetical protein
VNSKVEETKSMEAVVVGLVTGWLVLQKSRQIPAKAQAAILIAVELALLDEGRQN